MCENEGMVGEGRKRGDGVCMIGLDGEMVGEMHYCVETAQLERKATLYYNDIEKTPLCCGIDEARLVCAVDWKMSLDDV